jgi:hypothetical protein
MFQDKMLQWRDLEKAAADAEVEFQRLGQGVASPEAAALALKIKTLREEADALFSEILLSVPKS